MTSAYSELTAYDYLLIVDLESTCCDKDSIPTGEHEIIEIGAVMLYTSTLKIVDEFTTFIQPKLHPTLTTFCTELTTIKQYDVDTAPDFPLAAERFSQWLSSYSNYLFCSWGNYDRNHLASDSLRYEIDNPIQAPHLNIKKRFAKQMKIKPMGMQRALDLVDIELTGTHHRGIDDARNIALLVPYAFGLSNSKDNTPSGK
jgi:inhibitor of KinA sporulation pathway (predicted exonuclease)